ncbi:MAG: glucose-1-phosphate adenylyltransferase, partial [Clostridia bacterium]|nr:glucose-1-phosphate adenylyltransferase [Clostridia bacterium]
LWEANMDILSPASGINLNDPNWKIYARSPSAAPQYISDSAEVSNSMVTEGCSVEGKVDFSVLFPNAEVEEGANVKYSIVMPGAVVKKGATVQYAIVAEGAVIEEGAKVGAGPDVTDPDEWGVAVIGEKVVVGKDATVPANVMVNENVEEGTNYESK